jgi:DNA mismatch repair protein MSH5
MMSLCTSKSICLIDEFGKGTAPIDGMALLAAVIERFTKHSCRALIVMHFHEVCYSKAQQLFISANMQRDDLNNY